MTKSSKNAIRATCLPSACFSSIMTLSERFWKLQMPQRNKISLGDWGRGTGAGSYFTSAVKRPTSPEIPFTFLRWGLGNSSRCSFFLASASSLATTVPDSTWSSRSESTTVYLYTDTSHPRFMGSRFFYPKFHCPKIGQRHLSPSIRTELSIIINRICKLSIIDFRSSEKLSYG